MFKRIFLLFSLCLSSLSYSNGEIIHTSMLYEDEENIELLQCDNANFLSEDFTYPAKIIKMSDFLFGKNKKFHLYKFEFLIDPEFKFPLKDIGRPFTPTFSEPRLVTCYNNDMPRMTSYLYQSGKDENNNVSVYLTKSNIFELNIHFREH